MTLSLPCRYFLPAVLGCGTDRAQAAQFPALLEMVERAGELMSGGTTGFELGFEDWGGFEQEVEPGEYIGEWRTEGHRVVAEWGVGSVQAGSRGFLLSDRGSGQSFLSRGLQFSMSPWAHASSHLWHAGCPTVPCQRGNSRGAFEHVCGCGAQERGRDVDRDF